MHINQRLILFFAIILFSSAILNLYSQEGPQKWEETIRKFEIMDQEKPVAEGAILFVGSSSIAKWQDIGDYFPEHIIINRGFGGSNFEDLVYYADRVISVYQPSQVFVYEGDNDIAQGKSTASIVKEAKKLRKMLSKSLGKTVPVVFISPKPSVARWELREKYLELNSRLKDFAEKTANTEFADVWNPAIGPNGKVYEHIFLDDNLHMNAEGYKIWQEVLKNYLK